VEDDMTETETTKTCMVCGRPISEGEEAVPVIAEGGPLVGPEGPVPVMAEGGPLVEPPEGPALWAHLRCCQLEGPPSEK
jgi:hypothetical protein